MKKKKSKSIVADTSEYRRMDLKNGWDLPSYEKPYAVGRKRENARAYELLVLRSDEEYIKDAEIGRMMRQEKQLLHRIEAAETVVAHSRDIRRIRKPEAGIASGQTVETQGVSFKYDQDNNVPGERTLEQITDVDDPGRMPAEGARASAGGAGASAGGARASIRGAGASTGGAKASIRGARASTGGAAGVSGEERETLHGLSAVSESVWKKRHRRRILMIAALLLILIAGAGARFAFGPPILVADISGYEDVKITVEGLKDTPFDITPKELSKMKLTSTHVDVHQGELTEDDIPETGKAIGPSLETFLAKFGKTTDDFRSVRVYSGSDNSKAYVKTMQEDTVILSIANGPKPLVQKQAPLRIAIADQSTEDWFGYVVRIVFIPR